MNRAQVVAAIQDRASARDAFDQLESSLESLTEADLSNLLLDCGIIPEMYPHDSSAEKLWAKYCDILMSKAFSELGINSQVLRARGDSADVFGTTPDYTIVGDAKAFRLSRTAKNQKDFKISALDNWRKKNTFACLVSPFYQYPSTNSQIYAQAKEKNVTLLSYVHLKFLLDHRPSGSLRPLWEVPSPLPASKSGKEYWAAIEQEILRLTGQDWGRLADYNQLEIERTKQVGQEGIGYWESVIHQYGSLTREEAITLLLKSEKVESKIKTIQETIQRLSLPV